MVVVPVNAEIDKTHDVRNQGRNDRLECAPVWSLGCSQLQHHYRNQDCDHSIAECLKAPRLHSLSPMFTIALISLLEIASHDWTTMPRRRNRQRQLKRFSMFKASLNGY